MTDLECIVYGLLGTAVLEQIPLRPTAGPIPAVVEAHYWWCALVHRGVCRRWRCESTLGPPGVRSAMRLS